MTRKPFKYQAKAIRWGAGRDRFGLLWQMRLGKSLTAVRWAKQWHRHRSLIVCPRTSLIPWRDELENESISSLTIDADKWPMLKYPCTVGWFLCTYDRVRLSPWIVEQAWDVVILDEPVKIKNPQAKVTRVINGGSYKGPNGKRTASPGVNARARCVLSGLLNPESDLDWFEPMLFLTGGRHWMGCRNYWTFRLQYFQLAGFDWVPKKNTKRLIREAVKQDCLTLRRRQVGIGSRFVRERRYVQLPPRIRKAYRQAEKEFALGERTTKWAVVRSNWLAQLAGGCADSEFQHDAKVNEVVSLMTHEFKDEKVVVWFRFNAEIRAVHKALSSRKIPCATMTGPTTEARRRERTHQFNRGKTQVLLVQAKCAEYSWDFSGADTEIYFSRWDSGNVNEQTKDRIVHPEKNVPLLIVDLIAEGTTDEDRIEAVSRKQISARMTVTKLQKKARQRWQ